MVSATEQQMKQSKPKRDGKLSQQPLEGVGKPQRSYFSLENSTKRAAYPGERALVCSWLSRNQVWLLIFVKVIVGLGKAIATGFIYGIFNYQHKPKVLNKFYQTLSL